MSSTREYKIWFDMHRRCGAPSNKNFPRYGARGIRVCARWDSFESFIADMGNAHGLTLDRIDNEGDYEPNNCRWASRKQQSRNRTTARLISFNGETRCVSEWAEAIGIKPDTLKRRFLLGWSPERALIAFGETR